MVTGGQECQGWVPREGLGWASADKGVHTALGWVCKSLLWAKGAGHNTGVCPAFGIFQGAWQRWLGA